jgi:hypothetical protein
MDFDVHVDGLVRLAVDVLCNQTDGVQVATLRLVDQGLCDTQDILWMLSEFPTQGVREQLLQGVSALLGHAGHTYFFLRFLTTLSAAAMAVPSS